MKILVTGAGGFVARHLVPELMRAGHAVIAAVRNAASAPAGAEALILDLTDLKAGELPAVDAIIHLAQANVPWPEHATELHSVNTASTLTLLDHARCSGARKFILASSGAVYGFGNKPFSENDPVGPHNFYTMTKVHSENMVKLFAPFLSTSVVRIFSPYGCGQEKRLVPDLVARVREGRTVTANRTGGPWLSPIAVQDLVAGILALLEKDGHQVVNAAGDETLNLEQMARVIGEVLNRAPIIEMQDKTGPGMVCGDNRLFKSLARLARVMSFREGLESYLLPTTV